MFPCLCSGVIAQNGLPSDQDSPRVSPLYFIIIWRNGLNVSLVWVVVMLTDAGHMMHSPVER